jgi:sugar/nucleoside kinase (ribokinase family)
MVDIAVLTNAITDVTVHLTDAELYKLGFIKGFSNTRAKVSYAEFLELIKNRDKKYFPAGSPANVAFDVAYLGLESCIYGTVGKDMHGYQYIKNLTDAGITSGITQLDGPSAISYIMVTLDGEKSSITMMGIGSDYVFDVHSMDVARLFHTSGYELLTNPVKTKEYLDFYKRNNSLISFDLADPKVIIRERKSLEEILPQIDILFVTEEEAQAYGSNAAAELSTICPVVALKKGKKGSCVCFGKEKYDIPIYPISVINTNGAGDAYAAGFLYSFLHNENLESCGRNGSYIAAKVCGIAESHL